MYRFHIKYRSRQMQRAGPAKHAAYVMRLHEQQDPLNAHAEYVARTGKHAGVYEDLVFATTANLPHWAGGKTQTFWEACEQWERGNGRLAVTWEISLPRKLSIEQNITLTQTFLRAQFGDRHCYTIGMHDAEASDHGRNLHVHIVWSERPTDRGIDTPQQFFSRRNPKDRFWQERRSVLQLREAWAIAANVALEQADVKERLDPRSLTDRNVNRDPGIHFDATAVRQAKYRGTDSQILHALQQKHAERQKTREDEYTKAAQWWEETKQRLGIHDIHALDANAFQAQLTAYTRRRTSGHQQSLEALQAREHARNTSLGIHEQQHTQLLTALTIEQAYARTGKVRSPESARQVEALLRDTMSLDEREMQVQARQARRRVAAARGLVYDEGPQGGVQVRLHTEREYGHER